MQSFELQIIRIIITRLYLFPDILQNFLLRNIINN